MLSEERILRLEEAWGNLRLAELKLALRDAIPKAIKQAETSLRRRGSYDGSAPLTFKLWDALWDSQHCEFATHYLYQLLAEVPELAPVRASVGSSTKDPLFGIPIRPYIRIFR